MNTIRPDNSEFDAFWSQIFKKSDYIHPLYQKISLRYYRALINADSYTDIIDRSFIVVWQDQPLIAIRMFLIKKVSGDISELSCFGTVPLLYIEANDISSKQLRRARKQVKSEFEKVIESDQVNRIWYEDFLLGNELSYLGKMLLYKSAAPVPVFRQVVDLNNSETDLYRHIRKSYKSLINWGLKRLHIKVWSDDSFTLDQMERFRKLHSYVAGRQTRSEETWRLQWEMVCQQEAIAVYGELDGQLVTAALLPISSCYCFYGVSASKRELFDKPLSHAIIWEAILAAKTKKCHFFELGLIQFPSLGDPLPTQKELNISTFKHGFGGRLEPRIQIIWERPRD
jgi:hypothetical protein